MLRIARRNDHALFAGEAASRAGFKEPFDFLIDATDRLDFAQLIDGPCNGEILPDRQIGQTGEDRGQLGDRGAVSLDLRVGLFERQRGTHGKGV